MKEHELGSVKANLFDDYLIISLDKKWINVFGSLPSFNVSVNKDKRLCLQSQIIKSGAVVCE